MMPTYHGITIRPRHSPGPTIARPIEVELTDKVDHLSSPLLSQVLAVDLSHSAGRSKRVKSAACNFSL
jgi:hypothetical protein